MLMHTSTSYPFQVEFRNGDGGVASEITSLAVETLRVPEHVAPSGGAGTRTAPRYCWHLGCTLPQECQQYRRGQG